MRRYLLIFCLLCFCRGIAGGQPGIAETDSVTWQLYLSQSWEPLLDTADKAFKQGIDFFYLRVRAGVAAYLLKRYRESAAHFRKAYGITQQDDFLNGHYYWALVMAGWEDEAGWLAGRLTPEFRLRQQIPRKGEVNALEADFYYSYNTGYKALSSHDFEVPGSYSNYRALLKSQTYAGAALDHPLLPRLTLYHSLSHTGIERTEQYRSTQNRLDTATETSASQFQYYLHGRWLTGGGWTISAAVTHLWGKSGYHLPEYVSPGLYNLREEQFLIRDYLLCAGVAKDLPRFRPGLDAGFGKINRALQFQGNLGVTWYPFANSSLWLTPMASLHWDGSTGAAALITLLSAGVKAGPIWLSADYASGPMRNYYTGEGLVVYNQPEMIRRKAGITLWAPLLRHRADATLRWTLSEKEGTTFVYSNPTDFVTDPYRFKDLGFLISLKWNL